MFCPQCGVTQSEELNFCKSCGVNLYAVRHAVALREPGEKFDWSRTWVAEMFLSESERKRRKEQIERERGITPNMKRYTEIKAGVITSSVGVGVMIFLGNAGATPALRSANTAEFVPPSFGITEGTTKHLKNPGPNR